jgi:hypothetical protein
MSTTRIGSGTFATFGYWWYGQPTPVVEGGIG